MRIRRTKTNIVLIVLCVCALLHVRSLLNVQRYFRRAARSTNAALFNSVPTLRYEDNVPLGSLFFLDTSGRGTISPRSMCAIESAARHHPDRKVYMLMSHEPTREEKSFKLLNALSNVHVHVINVDNFFNTSHLRDWWVNEEWSDSEFKMYHIADALRLVILSRWGGVYLDTDIVTLQNFNQTPLVTVGIERDLGKSSSVNNAVIKAETKPPNSFITSLLDEFTSQYDPGEFSFAGPCLVTRVIEGAKFCNHPVYPTLRIQVCNNVAILSNEAFYPIDWPSAEDLLKVTEADHVMADVNQSIVVHMWGKITSEFEKVPANSAYGQLAAKHCPSAWVAFRDNFVY